MQNHKNYVQCFARCAMLIIFCSTIILTAGGCTPLRKKFTRQKKDAGAEDLKFIPVLDPIDYPEKQVSFEEKYKYHYSLWKVWNKDLLQNLEMDRSDKRQKFLLSQSIEQLEEMKGLLIGKKQTDIDAVISDLRKVLVMYEKPSAMRSKFTVRKKIELNAKTVRNAFAPENNLMYRNQL